MSSWQVEERKAKSNEGWKPEVGEAGHVCKDVA
jgi:hypothetical protein